jgi:dihydrodipicolinate synthase/N-acetylneuraminate lyase
MPGRDDLRDQIARLEAQTEQLAATREGCGKIIRFSRVVIAVGGAGILLLAFGLVRFDAAMLIAATAAVIGGIVVFGSNVSTLRQTMAAMEAAEAQRAELITQISPRLVEEHANASDDSGPKLGC